MRSPLGYPPLLGPAQSNDRRASGGGLARLIESSRDVMTSEIGTFQKCRSFRRRSAIKGKAEAAPIFDSKRKPPPGLRSATAGHRTRPGRSFADPVNKPLGGFV
jgi:hypothetical protein